MKKIKVLSIVLATLVLSMPLISCGGTSPWKTLKDRFGRFEYELPFKTHGRAHMGSNWWFYTDLSLDEMVQSFLDAGHFAEVVNYGETESSPQYRQLNLFASISSNDGKYKTYIWIDRYRDQHDRYSIEEPYISPQFFYPSQGSFYHQIYFPPAHKLLSGSGEIDLTFEQLKGYFGQASWIGAIVDDKDKKISFVSNYNYRSYQTVISHHTYANGTNYIDIEQTVAS